jgi:hypothetical protein
MKFDINDKKGGTDTNIWHGANVFDEEGKILDRVTQFDTETLLCTFGARRQVVAAGFCFCPGYEHGYNELVRFLPAGLRPFIVTGLLDDEGNFAEADLRAQRTKEFIDNYLKTVPKGHTERRECKNTQCLVCYPGANKKVA